MPVNEVTRARGQGHLAAAKVAAVRGRTASRRHPPDRTVTTVALT